MVTTSENNVARTGHSGVKIAGISISGNKGSSAIRTGAIMAARKMRTQMIASIKDRAVLRKLTNVFSTAIISIISVVFHPSALSRAISRLRGANP